MRVAVVRNNRQSGVLARFGEASLEAGFDDGAGMVLDALRAAGHTVVVCEGDMHLPDALARFMPPTDGGDPRGFVFNLSRGLQGECARSHVPAMLELCGVPYTGSGPIAHALTDDTATTRVLLERAGVPTARFAVLRRPGEEARELRFPLVVRPRRERPGVAPSTVHSRSQLAEAVERVADVCQQESLVEEQRGADCFAAALMRNGESLEPLPLLADGVEALRLVEPSVYSRIRRSVAAMTAAAFEACRCRDLALVRVAFDRDGHPVVASVDPSPRLTTRSVFVQAAVAGGYTYDALAETILDAAHERYFGTPAPRFDVPRIDRPANFSDLQRSERF